ncbi:hypothetical protein ANN_22572 [Periplaneta americana]|uniref:Uncharacterized protein n=1 Tax=Periplaneta americana TaxID=6978 RepID=A0ABQ8S9C7_PERAM|nr:hypothetical protein ANN_22572 [Periplaneta americana]
MTDTTLKLVSQGHIRSDVKASIRHVAVISPNMLRTTVDYAVLLMHVAEVNVSRLARLAKLVNDTEEEMYVDNNWILATLPIAFGGLGIRNVSDVCLPAFLASAYGVPDFVKSILSVNGDGIGICYVNEALEKWFSTKGNNNLPASRDIQKQWGHIHASDIYQALLASSSSEVDQARYHAIRQKESGSGLKTIPSSNIGTLMDNLFFKIAAALRLGCNICFPHKYLCGATVDPYGYHGLRWPQNTGRFSGHFQLNDIIKRALVSAGFPSILEPIGICRSD